MEETMPWSINKLMHLTRDELCGLAGQVITMLPAWEAGTVERSNALTSLDNTLPDMSHGQAETRHY
jgi:hypothetical protein